MPPLKTVRGGKVSLFITTLGTVKNLLVCKETEVVLQESLHTSKLMSLSWSNPVFSKTCLTYAVLLECVCPAFASVYRVERVHHL